MDFFKYCTLDNPIFQGALFWLAIFVVSGGFTLYFKFQEAKEEQAKAAEVTEKPAPKVKAATEQKKTNLAKTQETTQVQLELVQNEKKKAPKPKKPKVKKQKKEEDVLIAESVEKKEAIVLTEQDIDDGW